MVVLPRVVGDAAKALAWLLCLAAGGVQDAHAAVPPRPRRHLEETAVRAHPPVAIADAHRLLRGERRRQMRAVDDDVVVAEPMPLSEWNHAFALSPRWSK